MNDYDKDIPEIRHEEAVSSIELTGTAIPGEAKLGFAEILYGIIFAPAKTFRHIAKEPPLYYAFLVFLIITFLTSLTNTLIPPDLSGLDSELSVIIAKAGPFLGIIAGIFSFIGWIVQAGILQVFSELFGGRGSAKGVLTVLAFADIPRILVIPFQVIGYFAGGLFIGKFLTIAVSLVVVIWWAVLLVTGLREIQFFSTGKALAVLLLPVGIIWLALIIIIVSVISLVAPLVSGF